MASRILSSLILILTLPFTEAQAQNPLFGSTNAAARAVVVAVHATAVAPTADCLDTRLAAAFPEADFRSVSLDGLDDALPDLQRDGYTHILIQPDFISEDDGMEHLRTQVRRLQATASDVRVGEPLLSSSDDCLAVLHAVSRHSHGSVPRLIAVDTSTLTQPARSFLLLDYLLRDGQPGLEKWEVATSDGLPSLGTAIRRLRSDKVKRVIIVPLTLSTATGHFSFITQSWLPQLHKQGIRAEMDADTDALAGALADILVRHARQAATDRPLTSSEEHLRNSAAAALQQ